MCKLFMFRSVFVSPCSSHWTEYSEDRPHEDTLPSASGQFSVSFFFFLKCQSSICHQSRSRHDEVERVMELF